MSIRFRKSFGKGPFRITLSKSGIGYSVGCKGARLTKKAKGGTRTTLSIPGTGISYVKDSKKPEERKRNNNSNECEYNMKPTKESPKAHNAILHFLLGGLMGYIPTLYFMFSKKHYFKHKKALLYIILFSFIFMIAIGSIQEAPAPSSTNPIVIEKVAETLLPTIEEPIPTEAPEITVEPTFTPEPTPKITKAPTPKPTMAPTTTSIYYVYITSSGEKYHTKHCRYIKDAEVVERDINEVRETYTSCKVCNP